jgi:hypothetical protein
MRLDVNTDAAIQLTAKLEKLSRSAFPSAVRNTLNETAFTTKKLVPIKAKDNFTIRQKNLFNRLTIVDKANGFNVNSMVSRVGIDKKLDKVSLGIEKQETGGSLKVPKLLAHNLARISGSVAKKVKSKNYLKNIRNIGTSTKRLSGSKFFRIKKGIKETVFERISKNKILPIYNIRKNTSVNVKARPFLKPSAIEASKKMNEVYNKQAEFQFKKYLR